LLDARSRRAYVLSLMRKLGSGLVGLLLCASCSSVNDGAHDRLFGSPDDEGQGGASNVSTGGSASAGGDVACAGQSCGGTSCVNGEGDGCPSPSHVPPCAASQKECTGLCVDPSVDNGCGDPSCSPCPTVEHAQSSCHGDTCAFDCDAGYVQNGGACYPPSSACTDGAKNGNETDVDCGGDCPRCGSEKSCAHGADCLTAACVNGVCASASCDNGVQDSTETDIDCGGTTCQPCGPGLRCRVGSDCTDGACSDSVCRDSSCADRTRNGSETSVDCGGGSCSPCGLNAMCSVDADCASGHCIEKLCRIPCQGPGKSDPCPACTFGGAACCRSDQFCGCTLNMMCL
jgi:hypothetical protein